MVSGLRAPAGPRRRPRRGRPG